MVKPVMPVLAVCSLLFLRSFSCNAEIYKWIDEQGKVHFTDNPPNNKPAEEVKLQINTYSSVEIKPLVERLARKIRWLSIVLNGVASARKPNNILEKITLLIFRTI